MAGLFEKFKTQVVNSAISAVSQIAPYKIEEVRSDTYLLTYAKYQKVIKTEGSVLYKVANHHEMIYLCHEDSSTGQLVFNLFRIASLDEAKTLFEAYSETLNVISMSSSLVKDKKWLEKICNVQREHISYKPAHVAAALGIMECLKNELIQRMINTQDSCTLSTPLHVAIATKNVTFAKAMAELNGTDLNLADATGDTVLHLAAKNKDADLLKLLLKKSSDSVNNLNVAGKSALHFACELGSLPCVEALLASGADPNLSCCDLHPIHAAMQADALDCVGRLCDESEATVNVQDPREGRTALFFATSKKAVYFLTDLKADLNKTTVQGYTALHCAIKAGLFEVAYALLLRGADANIADKRGNTPLHSAVLAGSLDLVRALIVFEANVNTRNYDGDTVRHLAGGVKTKEAILYALHAVGATPCTEVLRTCWNGCRKGTTFHGYPPQPTVQDSEYGPEGEDSLLMEPPTTTLKGERVLCLDGGGIRGLILIQILRAIERCTGEPIGTLFDWIAGTSTGGILALYITHQRPLKLARCLYFMMKDEVFIGKRPYETTSLERVMKMEFGEHTKMTDVTHPKVMVTGLLADRFPPQLHLFRNYSHPKAEDHPSISPTSRFPPVPEPGEQLVWRAARASGAAPTFFRACGRFLDGGLISNNPTIDALTEIHEYKVAQGAHTSEQVEPIAVVVSVGCGRPPLTPVQQIDICRPQNPIDALRAGYGIHSLVKILVERASATDGRVVERARAWCHMTNISFHRFSTPLSSDIPLDCNDTPLLLQMLWETEVYLHRNQEAMAKVASLLTR